MGVVLVVHRHHRKEVAGLSVKRGGMIAEGARRDGGHRVQIGQLGKERLLVVDAIGRYIALDGLVIAAPVKHRLGAAARAVDAQGIDAEWRGLIVDDGGTHRIADIAGPVS